MTQLERILAEIQRLKKEDSLDGYTAMDSLAMIESYVNLLIREPSIAQGWQRVEGIKHPEPDKKQMYCVYTKGHYLLATVINHPNDDDLLQWKCTEFPHHRYDMCEGDDYLAIKVPAASKHYCHGITTSESFEVPGGFYIKKK